MRKITKISDAPEILDSEECEKKLKEIFSDRKNGKNDVKIDSSYYRGDENNNKSVLSALYSLYKMKCAYCEEERRKLDVEHYRPKNRVTEEDGHNGYYWLCYEWTNLILACKDCNRDWKKEHFPIKKDRIFGKDLKWPIKETKWKNLDELNKSEIPVLLNPEEDSFEPYLFLAFNKLGRIKGVDDPGRGLDTIKICNLNRSDLRKRRKKIIDQVVKQIKIALSALNADKSNLSSINNSIKLALEEININDDEIEHTFIHKKLVLDFKNLVLVQINEAFHQIIIEAFNEHFILE
jgi:hypothetical protein